MNPTFAKHALLASVLFAALAIPGFAQTVSHVPALGEETWTVVCHAGETNVAVVAGPEGAHLDVYVYDGRGRLVIAATGYTTWAYATWHTIASGTFYVRVVNRDRRSTAYVLRVE